MRKMRTTIPAGWYHLRSDAIEIFPGPQSYGGSEPAVLRFRKGAISQIIALSDNTQRTEYMLEPKLLSSVFDKDRVKRRLVKYDDIPPLLVHAVISAEDKRFFQHSGLDPVRITKSVVDDLRHGSKFEGASTLTQQLARMLWLNNNKTWRRKFAEMMITIHLERKLTKEQIFEYYANDVPLGRRGTFDIRGLGEASQAYFGVDIRNLTLDQAATLAGLIQEPSFRNPVRWPGRAKSRRNIVLKMMLENGYISQGQYEQARRSADVDLPGHCPDRQRAFFSGYCERASGRAVPGPGFPVVGIEDLYDARSGRCRMMRRLR